MEMGNVVIRVWSQYLDWYRPSSAQCWLRGQFQTWSERISLVQFCVEGVWQLQRAMISVRMLAGALGSLEKGQVSTAPVVVMQIGQLPWPNSGHPWPSIEWGGAQWVLQDFLVSSSSPGGAAYSTHWHYCHHHITYHLPHLNLQLCKLHVWYKNPISSKP